MRFRACWRACDILATEDDPSTVRSSGPPPGEAVVLRSPTAPTARQLARREVRLSPLRRWASVTAAKVLEATSRQRLDPRSRFHSCLLARASVPVAAENEG